MSDILVGREVKHIDGESVLILTWATPTTVTRELRSVTGYVCSTSVPATRKWTQEIRTRSAVELEQLLRVYEVHE